MRTRANSGSGQFPTIQSMPPLENASLRPYFSWRIALCGVLIVCLVSNILCAECFAACSPAIPSAPVTVDDETTNIQQSRQLVNGVGTVIDTTTPGQIKVNASAPAAITISNYSGGGAYTPSSNSFTIVTSATQINLPGTTTIPVGTVIALTIGGSQGATTIATDGGANDEHIIFNGSTTNTSLIIKNGDEIFLANQGSGTWLVTSFLPQGGSSGSTWTVSQGGTGSASLAVHGVLVGNGSSAVNVTSAGTSGQVLTSNGPSADPTFQTPAAGGVTSVSNSDGTLTISPTVGAVVASISNSVALPGSPTTTTQSPGDNSTKIATTAFVANATSSLLPDTLSSGNIFVGNGSNVAAAVFVSGDGTLSNTGVLTVTKTNGVPFAASATTNTTNASNITSGNLPVAQLPTLTSADIWVGNSSNAAAAVTVSGDGTLSNTGALTVTKTNGTLFAASATTDTTNASNITSGRLPLAQLPSLTSADIWVGNSSNAAAGVTVSGDGTLSNSGTLTVTKTNGTLFAASATTDTTNASNISSGTLSASRLPSSGVTAGTYTNATVTVDSTGRITSAASGQGFQYSLQSESASFTASGTSGTFYEISAGSSLTVTLPTSPANGTVLRFAVSGSGTVTYNTTGTDVITFGTTTTGSMIHPVGAVIELIAVSGGWQVT